MGHTHGTLMAYGVILTEDTNTLEPSGRPTKYREEYNEQARKLVFFGANDEQLAWFFGTSLEVITKWAYENKSFYNALTPTVEEINDHEQKKVQAKQKKRDYRKKYYSCESYGPARRLERSLRSRLYEATKGKTVSSSYFNFTIEELRNHLEKLFKPNMTWDNYGKWHVDHIKPCSAFDHRVVKEVKECWSLSNLQPLWASENLAKGSRYGSAERESVCLGQQGRW